MTTLYDAPKKGRKDAADALYLSKVKPPTESSRQLFTDKHRDAPRGFSLKVFKSGSMSFVLRYTATGYAKELTIGEYPTLSLVAARERAREYRQRIDAGENILAERARERNEPTVATLLDEYIRQHVKGLTSEKAITRYFERDVVPAIGDMKVIKVRRPDVLKMIEKKASKTPTAARHLLAYVKGFFEWCEEREYIEQSPAVIKPKSVKVEGKKNVLKPMHRERILDHGEIHTFWNEVDGCGVRRLTALALKLVLLTGQRPGEVAGMHESEIDGEVWSIPAERRGKTESEHIVPLCPLARKMIDEARSELERLSGRRKRKPGGFVFDTGFGSPMTVNAMDRAVKRYADQLGNKRIRHWGCWTPHDLRRTCRTEISEEGFPDEIGEVVIGHVKKGMNKVYNQSKYLERKREALAAWEKRLETIVGSK